MAMDKIRDALECYQKALEFEPDNESYKNNLSVAEEKFRQSYPQLGNSHC